MARNILIGIGGMGVNFLSRIQEITYGSPLETITIETTEKRLANAPVTKTLLLGVPGQSATGSKGDPNLGREAAEMHTKEIGDLLHGADLVFLVAGGGGGTGSGATPVIASIAKKAGVKTVISMITLPHEFEGPNRAANANATADQLKINCNLALVFPNERLGGVGIMRSILIPPNLADSKDERLVLGDEDMDFFLTHRRGDERLLMLVMLFQRLYSDSTTTSTFAQSLLDGFSKGSLKWLGFGGGTIGNRGVYEALARAINWSIVGQEDITSINHLKIHILMGEKRPDEEIAEIPWLLNNLLGRVVKTEVDIRIAQGLKQKVRLILIGL